MQLVLIIWLCVQLTIVQTFVYTAVLVEPRQHIGIHYVIQNALNSLSSDWSVLFVHGKNNSAYAKEVLRKFSDIDSARVLLADGGFDELNHSAHSNILRSEKFYDLIPTETHLLFQTDTIICEEHKELINNFMEYDYVGAPWPFFPEVGNGGLSLRKKSKLVNKIRQCELILDTSDPRWEPEDMWFSKPCGNLTKPTRDKAKEFSNEFYMTDISFGCHKIWHFHTHKQVRTKIAHCKALYGLMKIYNFI